VNEQVLEGLVKYLRNERPTDRSEVQEILVDQGLVDCEERPHVECPKKSCDEYARVPTDWDDKDEKVTVVCNGTGSHRSEVLGEQLLSCSLNPDAVMDAVCGQLRIEDQTSIDSQLPDYIRAFSSNDVDICLITSSNSEEEIAERIIQDAVQHRRVVVLLSPAETVEHIVEILDEYATTIVRVYPLANLADETATLNRLTRSATIARDREAEIQKQYDLDDDDTLAKLSRNPGSVGEKLADLTTLRMTGGMANNDLADQFEETCRAAFRAFQAAVLPGEGGGTDRGYNVADTAFELPEVRYKNYPSLFAVVDAKSGAKARLDDEEIIRKHKRYIERAYSYPHRAHHVAHVVVVHSLSGAEDIRWYERLKDASDRDYTVVALKVGALYQLVSCFCTLLVEDAISLATADPVEVVRPFFDKKAFETEVDGDIQTMGREVTLSSDDLPGNYETYEEAITGSQKLIVVTEEMVTEHLRRELGKDKVARNHRDYYHP